MAQVDACTGWVIGYVSDLMNAVGILPDIFLTTQSLFEVLDVLVQDPKNRHETWLHPTLPRACCITFDENSGISRRLCCLYIQESGKLAKYRALQHDEIPHFQPVRGRTTF
jgi:hypothetical protein